ncbi:MAG: hypothetical protein ONB55_21925 [candidate division KSB1 bacterium]|nr:hypothetical protein [candidate division KSB1 bacterium]
MSKRNPRKGSGPATGSGEKPAKRSTRKIDPNKLDLLSMSLDEIIGNNELMEFLFDRRGKSQRSMDSQSLRRLFLAVRTGMTYEGACSYSGISERTFYRWKSLAAEAESGVLWQFWQILKKAEAEAKFKLLQDIQMDQSWQSSAWILERRWPNEYGRQILDLNSEGPLKITVVLPDDEQ